jgi:hypothetical protein
MFWPIGFLEKRAKWVAQEYTFCQNDVARKEIKVSHFYKNQCRMFLEKSVAQFREIVSYIVLFTVIPWSLPWSTPWLYRGHYRGHTVVITMVISVVIIMVITVVNTMVMPWSRLGFFC